MSAKTALIEVASVLAIMGSVAVIAIPKTATIQNARVADLVGQDVETVRAAVYAFHSDSAYFPPEGPQGDIPVTLEPYLPAGFSFRRQYGTLEYKHWPATTGFVPAAASPTDSARASTPPPAQADSVAASPIIAVRLTPRDASVGAIAAQQARRMARFIVGDEVTFVLFGA